MEFKEGIFHARKVMENDCGHGKSWRSHGISPIFLTEDNRFRSLILS